MGTLTTLLQAGADFSLLEEGYKVGLDWLGQFARVIIENVPSIGLGIILFTLVLKAITLPFDIYQRYKMRKQNLIMHEMRGDLEKLQKQYANDKNMYNTKMMELYKKNGYNLLGACLPMIISLVILIVAFQGFRAYSQYANLSMFENMSSAYNAAILEHGVDGKDYHLPREDDDALSLVFEKDVSFTEDGVVYTMFSIVRSQPVLDENGDPVRDGNGEIPYLRVVSADDTRFVFYEYSLRAERVTREYKLDVDKLYAALPSDAPVRAAFDEAAAAGDGAKMEDLSREYVVSLGSSAAKAWYEEHDAGFLWIKNVWYPDVSYNHPIPTYSEFRQQVSATVTLSNGERQNLANVFNEKQYENLTSQLVEEKSQPNGYFILIILSIGLMVLSQLVMMKSQKDSNKYQTDSNKYQTVDGQGARTQKVMLVVMPLIYAVFAFMYSAAFSIYMCMSSIVALAVTLATNFFLGRVFRKKEEEAIKAQYGRQYEWMKKDRPQNDGKKKRKK